MTDIQTQFKDLIFTLQEAQVEFDKKLAVAAEIDKRKEEIDAREAKLKEETELLVKERENIDNLRHVVDDRQTKLNAQIARFQNLFQN